jgi:hypothetical protein
MFVCVCGGGGGGGAHTPLAPTISTAHIHTHTDPTACAQQCAHAAMQNCLAVRSARCVHVTHMTKEPPPCKQRRGCRGLLRRCLDGSRVAYLQKERQQATTRTAATAGKPSMEIGAMHSKRAATTWLPCMQFVAHPRATRPVVKGGRPQGGGGAMTLCRVCLETRSLPHARLAINTTQGPAHHAITGLRE